MASCRVKRMLEQEKLTAGIHMGAVPPSRIPGVSDLDSTYRWQDIVVSGRSNHRIGGCVAHDPGEHMPVTLPRECSGDVLAGAIRLGDRSIPEVPEFTIARGGAEVVVVVLGQWLQSDAVTLENNGL